MSENDVPSHNHSGPNWITIIILSWFMLLLNSVAMGHIIEIEKREGLKCISDVEWYSSVWPPDWYNVVCEEIEK